MVSRSSRSAAQRALRLDDEREVANAVTTDRAYWEAKASVEVLRMVDTLVEQANKHTQTPHNANYNKGFVGLHNGQRANNFMYFRPRKAFLKLITKKVDTDVWVDKLEEAGVSAETNRKGYLVVKFTPKELQEHRELIDSVVKEAASGSRW